MSTLVPPPWLVQPLDPADFAQSAPPTDPGFTQLVNDTLGDLGSPADGFDEALSGLSDIVNALDSILAEQDAALDGVLLALSQIDTTPADTSFNNFLGSFDAGRQIVAGAQALTPPDLLEMPISVEFGVALGPAPQQVTRDLGTVHVGDPSITVWKYDYFTGGQPWRGAPLLGLANGDPDIWHVRNVLISKDPPNVRFPLTNFEFTFWATPVKAGTFIAQLNSAGPGLPITITTYTLIVLP